MQVADFYKIRLLMNGCPSIEFEKGDSGAVAPPVPAANRRTVPLADFRNAAAE